MEKLLKLKEVCEIKGGYAFKSTQYKSKGIPLIRIGDISDNVVEISDESVYIDDDVNKYDKFIIKKGDILIALSGATTGKFGIYNYDELALLNQRVAKIKPNELVEKKYIFYYLNKLKNNIYSKALGCAQPNISPTEIGDLDIYLPSLEQQQQIVSVLDKISLLIDKRKKQLTKLDELVKSRFVEMFGDPVENDKGWQHQAIDKVAPSSAWAGDNSERVWLLNLDMVEAQTGRIIDCLYIEKEQVGTSTHGFDEGNVLYSKLRPYLNKVVVPTKKGYCTTELVPLRPNAMLNRQFLANLLRSEAFVSFIKEKVVGAKMPRVSMNVFREFECILPPLELQEQFAAFVEQIEKVKLHVQKSLQKLETLKQAQMQKYFG